MFPHHILIHDAFHTNLRAEQRDIDMNHAVLAAREGIEHMGAGNVLHHDAVTPEDPTRTIRVVTSASRNKAITAYYLPTEEAVRQREDKQARVKALREREASAKTTSIASAKRTAVAKHSQREKQMMRGHRVGEHGRAPHKDCPLC